MTIVLNATYDDPFDDQGCYAKLSALQALLDDQEYMIEPCGARNDNGRIFDYPFTTTQVR
jgi:hypothetical protein